MNIRMLAGIPALAILLNIGADAQVPTYDIAAPDTATMLKTLEGIRVQQEKARTTELSRSVEQVMAASANAALAMDFYEKAIMATQFDGLTKENTQMRDWKTKEQPKLKDKDFQESVRMHLYYLGLSLKRASGLELKALMPQLISYMKLLEGSTDAINAQNSLLKIPVNNGVFAKWLHLKPLLDKADDWEMNPGDMDAIATKVVQPELRLEKSPMVFDYWDAKISLGSEATEQSKLQFGANDFAMIRKPSLLWKRTQEYLALNQRNRAITEMFNLIKTYPSHPEIETWIASLEKTLSSGSAPAKADNAAGAAGTPPAAPTIPVPAS